ncbi:MAG: glutamate-5-semialdehyde dehydrogenase [Bacteroidetes bacterium]|jgi:glutamate-5-semialdehyde dehydrogenase|nr:glutamate-5-semialdehyde dehydrogenase [Bacteroidota bacterium]
MPRTLTSDPTTDTPSTEALAAACQRASRQVAQLPTAAKNRVLEAMADRLQAHEDAILDANARDLEYAQKHDISAAMVDRLELNPARIAKMADALREVASFEDPVGRMADVRRRPSGIEVGKMRIPLGVIAMIYESRPNVTADAAGLCFKAGNGVVLRGGSEAFHSNHAIADALHAALDAHDIPPAAITLLPTTDRSAITELIQCDESIDLVIPRGGEGLIRFVDTNSHIPVIKHYKGVCHLYVDRAADLDVAMRLLIDGKLSRQAVCNALETLLVHEDVADDFLPQAYETLDEAGVELRGCDRTQAALPDVTPATDDDYGAEFLGPILAVKVVGDYDAATNHIAQFGSNHTDVIATDDLPTARRFTREVDSSVVLVNASSRFSDGGQLGLGAEIGISTTKLHAFGPMGLDALTTEKFVVHGQGETRHDLSTLT